MTKTQLAEISSDIVKIAKEAGRKILEIYHAPNLAVEEKGDNTPLTEADRQSHDIIYNSLKKKFPFPVLSEEGSDIQYSKRKDWEYFWLVDPLDGTKEFIKRNGEFTVNIALIHRDKPVIGVIYAPAADILYHAAEGNGSYKIENGKEECLPFKIQKDCLTVIGSRSHNTKENEEYLQTLREKRGDFAFISAGSSLKFCLIAEGRADIYPRAGHTMEWDTAAGQIIVQECGGSVLEIHSSEPLKYNKPILRNAYFVALRSGQYA
jgi:3'(2'), 5'-bisphosphate nucleotidase